MTKSDVMGVEYLNFGENWADGELTLTVKSLDAENITWGGAAEGKIVSDEVKIGATTGLSDITAAADSKVSK